VRPDVVINMQDGFNIIIDAKAPINEFAARLGDNLSEEDNAAVMQGLARQVRDHVKRLGSKNYWEHSDASQGGPDFVVMFLPSEHIYSIALRADPEIVDMAARLGVIIASPTLLMSLLRVVGLSWRQIDLAKNAQEISERGMELYKRFLIFTDHMGKVGKGLQSAMGSYDAAIGSLEKSVLPAARKFKELPEFKAVEQPARVLTLAAEDEKEKKRA
jgi:DNA recombination protein RmuC